MMCQNTKARCAASLASHSRKCSSVIAARRRSRFSVAGCVPWKCSKPRWKPLITSHGVSTKAAVDQPWSLKRSASVDRSGDHVVWPATPRTSGEVDVKSDACDGIVHGDGDRAVANTMPSQCPFGPQAVRSSTDVVGCEHPARGTSRSSQRGGPPGSGFTASIRKAFRPWPAGSSQRISKTAPAVDVWLASGARTGATRRTAPSETGTSAKRYDEGGC